MSALTTAVGGGSFEIVRGYAVHEDQAQYTSGIDPDTDSDPDTDGTENEQIANHCLEATLDGAPQADDLPVVQRLHYPRIALIRG